MLLTIATGCGSDQAESPAIDGPVPVVYTVNYPLSYFAERIGGDAVEVVFPDMDGDPAYWQPTPEQVSSFQEADLILLNGARYAGWVPTVSLPSAKMVNTGSRLIDRLIVRDDVVTHTHGPGGAHTHGQLAFTTWLDPTMAIEHARSIAAAFSRTWPQHTDDFERRLTELTDDLEALDADLSEITSRINQPLVMSHPVFQYLERRYNLDARSVHFEPDEAPDESAIAGLRDLLSEHPSRWMIWEGEPGAESVNLLEGLGLGSVVFDPCGNRPGTGDYMTVMRKNVEALASIPSIPSPQ